MGHSRSEMEMKMKLLDITDPWTYSADLLALIRDNLNVAARACGFSEIDPTDTPRFTAFGHALVETLAFAQGRRNASVEVADAITVVATTMWAVPDGEDRGELEALVQSVSQQIAIVPLEEETRAVNPS